MQDKIDKIRRVVYIAGKITGEKNGNKVKFAHAEKRLRSSGYKTINPHTLCSDIHPEASWSTFMKRCVSEITKCDIVVVLEDWHLSKGAQLEVELACNLEIPVWEISTMKPIDFKYRAFPTFQGAILNVR